MRTRKEKTKTEKEIPTRPAAFGLAVEKKEGGSYLEDPPTNRNYWKTKEKKTRFRPCGHRVLVMPDDVEEMRGSLYVPQSVRDKEQYEQIFGTVVRIGRNAWKGFDDGHPWAEVGDRVMIAKYGGFIVQNPKTGECLRLLNDEDICIVDEGEDDE